MGKPAARLGDQTAHGGAIVVGVPTVLIGGMPAARVGDMHVCPMLNPGTPPPPHVGGPVAMGSPTVLIGGAPAARMGDMATCAGPPDTIAAGCPTVLIGESGSGSAGGGGAAQTASDNAHASLVGEAGPEAIGPHWIEYQFVDSAGLPVTGVKYDFTDIQDYTEASRLTRDGVVRRGGLPDEGDCNIVLFDVRNASWSVDEARVGDVVELSADTEGFEDGEIALITIYTQDINGADSYVTDIEAEVSGNKIEAEWTYEYPEGYLDTESVAETSAFSAPEYYFNVAVKDCSAKSGLLAFQDWLEIELKDAYGEPVANEEYILYLSNGEVRRGTLDSNGYKREENIPPVTSRIEFPNFSGGVSTS